MLIFLKSYWSYIVFAVLLALAIWGIFERGVKQGEDTTELKYSKIIAQRDAAILNGVQLTAELRDKLQTLSTATTLELSKAFAAADEAYLKGLEDGKNKTQAVIDDLRANNQRLSVNIRTRVRGNGCSSDTSGDSPSTRSDYVTTRGELSEEASRFFIGEANRADEIVKQLTSCQVTAKKMHDLVNAYALKVKAMEPKK